MEQTWYMILFESIVLVFIIYYYFHNPISQKRWYRLNKYRYFSDVFTKEFQEKFGIEIFVQFRFLKSRIVLIFDLKENDWLYGYKFLSKISRSAFIDGEKNRYIFGDSFVFLTNDCPVDNRVICAFLLKDKMAVVQLVDTCYLWEHNVFYEKTGTFLFLVKNVLFVCRPGKQVICFENVKKVDTWVWSDGRTEGIPYNYVRYKFFMYEDINGIKHLCDIVGNEIVFQKRISELKEYPKFDQELCILEYTDQDKKMSFYVVYNLKSKTWSQEKKYVKITCFEDKLLLVELVNGGYVSTIVSRYDFSHECFRYEQMISYLKRAENVIALRTNKPGILLLDSEFNITASIDEDQDFSEINRKSFYGETFLEIKVSGGFFLWNIRPSSRQFPWILCRSIRFIDPQKKIVGLEIEKDVFLGFSLETYNEVPLTNYAIK